MWRNVAFLGLLLVGAVSAYIADIPTLRNSKCCAQCLYIPATVDKVDAGAPCLRYHSTIAARHLADLGQNAFPQYPGDAVARSGTCRGAPLKPEETGCYYLDNKEYNSEKYYNGVTPQFRSYGCAYVVERCANAQNAYNTITTQTIDSPNNATVWFSDIIQTCFRGESPIDAERSEVLQVRDFVTRTVSNPPQNVFKYNRPEMWFGGAQHDWSWLPHPPPPPYQNVDVSGQGYLQWPFNRDWAYSDVNFARYDLRSAELKLPDIAPTPKLNDSGGSFRYMFYSDGLTNKYYRTLIHRQPGTSTPALAFYDLTVADKDMKTYETDLDNTPSTGNINLRLQQCPSDGLFCPIHDVVDDVSARYPSFRYQFEAPYCDGASNAFCRWAQWRKITASHPLYVNYRVDHAAQVIDKTVGLPDMRTDIWCGAPKVVGTFAFSAGPRPKGSSCIMAEITQQSVVASAAIPIATAWSSNSAAYNLLAIVGGDPNSRTRGCSGYGFCPTNAVSNKTCSAKGRCMTNGKCFCNPGFGGLACELVVPDVYTKCSQFNPCSENGWCIDSPTNTTFPTCKCHAGWMGTPASNTTLFMYGNEFFCGGPDAPCVSALTDATLLKYVRDHQCLLFYDPRITHIKRYVRHTGYPWDNTHGPAGALIQQAGFPLWYNGNADLQLNNSLTTRIVSQIMNRGFNCLDTRNMPATDRDGLPPVLYGGPECRPCPDCTVGQSDCVSAYEQDPLTYPDIFTTVRACKCRYGFTNSNTFNITTRTCDTRICPINTTVSSLMCGGTERGVCNTSPVVTPASGFTGRCECRLGFDGPACEFLKCPMNVTSQLICNGFSGDNISPGNNTGLDAHATGCNVTSGVCTCGPTKKNGPLSMCELARCPLGPNGLECNGMQVAPGQPYSTICDNIATTAGGFGTCQCWRGRLAGSLVYDSTRSFYGSACELPFATACNNPLSGTLCSGAGGCYAGGDNLPVVADVVSPSQLVPTCHCNDAFGGKYCQLSNCASGIDNVSPIDVCGSTNIVNTKVPTGTCVQFASLSFHDDTPYCSEPKACPYGCKCSVINKITGLPCDLSVPNADCGRWSNVDPAPDRLASPRCIYNLTGCTTWLLNANGAGQGAYAICGKAGPSYCTRLAGEVYPSCKCPFQYNGTYCQTLASCGNACDADKGACADGVGDGPDVCHCNAWYNGTTCQTNMCGGSYPGTFTSIAGVQNCSCPIGSTFRSPVLHDLARICTASDRNVRGCIKDCPAYRGVPCGSCTNDGTSRCNSTTTLATSTAGALSCNCAGFAPSTTSQGVNIPWTNSSNGACEPYCVEGQGSYTPNSNPWTCVCASGWSGPRCSISVCFNGGVYNANRTACDCSAKNVNFPFTSVSNCNTTACDVTKGEFYNATADQDRCSCRPPYVPAKAGTGITGCVVPCLNGGTASLVTGNCTCPAFFYGATCKETDCTTTTGGVCTCNKPNFLYNSATRSCQPATCLNSGTFSTITNKCNCLAAYHGNLCEVDSCAPEGHAASNGLTCVCGPGHAPDPVVGGIFCTGDLCDDPIGGGYGTPDSSCGQSCKFYANGISYNCACGHGVFAFVAARGIYTCTAPDCSGNGRISRDSVDGAPYCVCNDGYVDNPTDLLSTTAPRRCGLKSCNTNSRVEYVGGKCQCNPPWSGSTATGCMDINSKCGAGGIGATASMLCQCKANYSAKSMPGAVNLEVVPCSINCNTTGTLHVYQDSCTCMPSMSGALCDVNNTARAAEAAVKAAVTAASKFSDAEIAGIAIGSFVGFVFFLWEASRIHDWYTGRRGYQPVPTKPPIAAVAVPAPVAASTKGRARSMGPGRKSLEGKRKKPRVTEEV